MTNKKETFEANEGFILGDLINKQLNIQITRVIGIKLTTENICVDEDCLTVELALYRDDSWIDCDLTFKVDCKMCYGHPEYPNPIFTDKTSSSYEEIEVINELGLATAVQKHFQRHHLEFYQNLLEDAKE